MLRIELTTTHRQALAMINFPLYRRMVDYDEKKNMYTYVVYCDDRYTAAVLTLLDLAKGYDITDYNIVEFF